MARAKSTERAEARRRWRAEHPEHTPTEAAPEAEIAADASSDPVQGPRRGLVGTLLTSFRRPNYRADLAAAPAIFMGRRLLWVPFLIVLATAVVYAISPVFSATSSTSGGSWEAMFVGLFLAQPMILYFAVGYLAPRASYVFGAAIAALASLLYIGILLVRVGSPTAEMSTTDLAMSMLSYTVIQALTGALMAGFASWYRDFLKSTAAKNRTRTEVRRKEERRDARRPASKGSAQAR